LRDITDLIVQRFLCDVADIDTIDSDLPCGHVIEARDQVDQGTLSRAGRADEGRGLTALGGKSHVMQDIFIGLGITEGDVFEFNDAGHIRIKGFGIFRIDDLVFNFQDIGDTAG